MILLNHFIDMKKVVLYSMNNCPHCQTAKKFFEQENITFRLCNVKTAAGQKEFYKTGLRGVPAFKIGDRLISGFNLKQLKQLLV